MQRDVEARLRLSIAGAFLIAAISCGGSDGTTGPDNSGGVASLGLGESAVSVQVGFSHKISVAPKSASGAQLAGITITWASDNPAVATVNDGLISALQTGTARITASASGKTATVTVTAVPTVVAALQISRTSATLSPRRTARIIATPLDSLARVIDGRGVAFFTSDASIATVSSTGLVTAVGVGTASITVASDQKNGVVSVFVVLPTTVAVPISSEQPSGLSSSSSYSLWMRDADDSVGVAGAIGSPSTLSGSMAIADSVQFVAQGDPASANASWLSTITAARGELPASVPVVIIPRSFLLTSGSFAGTTAFINVTAALNPCLIKGDQCGGGFYSNFSRGVTGWASFPVPVYLQDITGADSAAIWASLRAMETAFGRPLFTPYTGTSNHITVALGVPSVGCGGSTIGCAFWQWDAYDRMTGAQVFVAQSALGRPNTIQHEFLHALGFFHTCDWPSVMGGYGCPEAAQITVGDVAYASLAMAVYTSEASVRLSNGLLPCGTMGLFAAAPDQHVTVSCDGDSFRVIPGDAVLANRLVGPLTPGGGSAWAK
jgi:hypothetical protein